MHLKVFYPRSCTLIKSITALQVTNNHGAHSCCQENQEFSSKLPVTSQAKRLETKVPQQYPKAMRLETKVPWRYPKATRLETKVPWQYLKRRGWRPRSPCSVASTTTQDTGLQKSELMSLKNQGTGLRMILKLTHPTNGTGLWTIELPTRQLVQIRQSYTQSSYNNDRATITCPNQGFDNLPTTDQEWSSKLVWIKSRVTNDQAMLSHLNIAKGYEWIYLTLSEAKIDERLVPCI